MRVVNRHLRNIISQSNAVEGMASVQEYSTYWIRQTMPTAKEHSDINNLHWRVDRMVRQVRMLEEGMQQWMSLANEDLIREINAQTDA